MTAAYPAEPWQLRGRLHASVFLAPLTDVPADLPAGWLPVRVGRFGVVCAAWVRYAPGGVLAYDELLSTLLVRRGRRVGPSITHIWVDSAASREGGRDLWAIPKKLATLDLAGPRFACRDDEGPIATATARPGVTLPWRLPFGFRIVQSSGGGAKVTSARVRGRFGLCRVAWDAGPGGPLAFLAGRRPLLSVSLGDFRMTFGRR